jgi:hypothetical protein
MELSKLRIKLPSFLKKLKAQIRRPVAPSVEDESATAPGVDSEAVGRIILAALEVQSSPSMRIGSTSVINALTVTYSSLSIPTPE